MKMAVISIVVVERFQKTKEKTGGRRNQKKNGDRLDHSIVKIDYNTKKIPCKTQLSNMVWKICKVWNTNNLAVTFIRCSGHFI